MPAVSAAHRGDAGRMPRMGKPVVDGRSDLASRDGWFAGAMMTGDEEQNAISGGDALLERAVDRLPGGIQAHPVQVERAVRRQTAGLETFVPSAVECPCADRRRSLQPFFNNVPNRLFRRYFMLTWLRRQRGSRQRPNGRRNPRPQLRFVRVERAHGRPRPSATGSTPGRWPTSRRRSRPHRDRDPKRCRSGSGP